MKQPTESAELNRSYANE